MTNHQLVADSYPTLLAAALEETGITKDALAREMDVHLSGVYRLLSGNIKKSKIVASVRAVNKLAMYQVLDESEALRSAGFDAPNKAAKIDEIRVAEIIDLTVNLPDPVQADILEIIRALHKNHAA